jgi:excisionase family DNA binding protein
MRPELQTVLDSIAQMPVEAVPEVVGDLERCKTAALLRLTSNHAAPQQHDDKLLNIKTAAERLNVSRDYLYRNSDQLSFTRRVGRRLLFSSLEIDKFIRQKKTR